MYQFLTIRDPVQIFGEAQCWTTSGTSTIVLQSCLGLLVETLHHDIDFETTPCYGMGRILTKRIPPMTLTSAGD